ncbi:hypothetical protein V2J09_023205 [Rumex salicifolius]
MNIVYNGKKRHIHMRNKGIVGSVSQIGLLLNKNSFCNILSESFFRRMATPDLRPSDGQNILEEEIDNLQRFNKKVKRTEMENSGEIMEEISQAEFPSLEAVIAKGVMGLGDEVEWDVEDDKVEEDQDPLCSTIALTAEEKDRIRQPWKNAIIIKVLDQSMGYIYVPKEEVAVKMES